MDIDAILKWLESTSAAASIRESLYLFPFLEAAHVVGLALVFGTIAVLDLRLLGKASTERPFARVSQDILKWTWAAFVLTGLTGALMFITNAGVYYHNVPFRLKMGMLFLGGLNTAVFELTTGKRRNEWGNAPSAPSAGKAAAMISLVLWVGVIFAGRWIGFTATRSKVSEPPPAGVNFDDFLGGGDPAPPQAK